MNIERTVEFILEQQAHFTVNFAKAERRSALIEKRADKRFAQVEKRFALAEKRMARLERVVKLLVKAGQQLRTQVNRHEQALSRMTEHNGRGGKRR